MPLRHGLSAETVVTPIEDMEDYLSLRSELSSQTTTLRTAVERELVLRLASLLWRLRRATSIETGLLQAHSKLQQKKDRMLLLDHLLSEETDGSHFNLNGEITQCFSRLANTDGSKFQLVRRYETTLWRQLRQTLSTLKMLSLAQKQSPRRVRGTHGGGQTPTSNRRAAFNRPLRFRSSAQRWRLKKFVQVGCVYPVALRDNAGLGFCCGCNMLRGSRPALSSRSAVCPPC